MVFSNAIELNLLRSLRYVTDTGDAGSSLAPAFPVGAMGTPEFVANEQAFNLVATGLKPGTVHRAFLNGINVTGFCKQVGRSYGSGLITEYGPPSRSIVPIDSTKSGGEIYFTFYYTAEIDATTPVEQAGAAANLIAGQRILRIVSDDGKSVAEIAFIPPLFAKNEPEVRIQKTPSEQTVRSDVKFITTNQASVNDLYYTPQNYSLIQTFYADSEIIDKSGNVFLTSVDLFFKAKPNLLNNVTGNPLPGVSIAICEVENNEPVLTKTYVKSLSYKPYYDIFSYSDASTGVTFGFNNPIRLATGRFYGIVVIFEDPAYALWTNKVGNSLIGTNTASPGVNSNKDGKLFLKNNANVYNPISDTDLKFTLRCAQFISNNEVKTYVANNYEFLSINTRTGSFIGGESVFKNKAVETGTISIVQGTNVMVGSFTNFNALSNNEIFVISNGTGPGNNHIAIVDVISNATYLTTTNIMPFTNTAASYIRTAVGKTYYQDVVNNKLYLTNSNANTIVFAPNDIVVGVISGARANVASVDNLSIDRVRAKADVRVPSTTKVSLNLKGTAFNPSTSTYAYNQNNSTDIIPNALTSTEVSTYDSYVLSRSNEVGLTLYSNTQLKVLNKSLHIDVEYSAFNNNYQSPIITDSSINLFLMKNLLSSNVDLTRKDSVGTDVVVDGEVLGNLVSQSRHIGKKITFGTGRRAEDVRVYLTAYRPLNTDVKVYAKLYNSQDLETFDDKVWTPLTYIGENSSKFSSSEDTNDFVEYELGLQDYPEASTTLTIPFNVTYNSNAIAVTDSTRLDPTDFIVSGDVVRILNPVSPETNYIVSPVSSANATHIILSSAVTSNNVVGSSMVIEKVKYPTSAFNNPENDNICRYFNTLGAAYDTFDTMQVKIVFTGDFSYRAPKVDQIQVIGVSA
jgi:hypothetical protein